MNTKPISLTLSESIEGWTIAARARRLSINTLNDYGYSFRRFQAFIGRDLQLAAITTDDIKRFMAGLDGLSDKTALNIHTALSSLWNWAASEKVVERNIVRDVEPPDPEERAISPFSQQDVKAMLGSLERSKPYTRPGKRECTHAARQMLRNRAIILLLLDCGLRASELAGLKIRSIDKRNSEVKVFGKGDKERILPFSPSTGQALWRYIATRSGETVDASLFMSEHGRPPDRDELLKIVRRIGDRAGVPGVHLHRFRHTFAINFLRNGGNVYALQMMLGHTTLSMCRRYLAISQADLQVAQQRASVVSNWNL